ncbi:ABC transporter permease [Streptomyces sp. NPDC026092]|uniref:ABC transporter permease n=1 Tax=Streptomyces sp. NPDC026092 TaxID=3154797 RepID=UPI00340F8142
MTSLATVRPSAEVAIGEPRPRFRDLLAAEWIKLWSLRSTPWSLLLTELVVLAFNVGTAYDHYRYWPTFDPEHQALFVADRMALWDAFNGNAALVVMLAFAAFGSMTVVGEYSSGMIRTTFAAVPARRAVMAAKVVVVATVTTAVGAIVAASSFAATQGILSARGAGFPITEPGALRLVVASALLAPVSALVGMAIGAVLRRSGATIVTSVVVLLLVPAVITEQRYWSAVVSHTLPYGAWERLVQAGPYEVPFPWSPGGAWCVYGAWALVAAVVTVTAVHRRDQ